MGKFSRSWQLVMQSFAILRSDKQLMLFPVFFGHLVLYPHGHYRYGRRVPGAAGASRGHRRR